MMEKMIKAAGIRLHTFYHLERRAAGTCTLTDWHLNYEYSITPGCRDWQQDKM